jgi:hypothetical protein
VRIYQYFPSSIFFSETTGLLLNHPWLGWFLLKNYIQQSNLVSIVVP